MSIYSDKVSLTTGRGPSRLCSCVQTQWLAPAAQGRQQLLWERLGAGALPGWGVTGRGAQTMGSGLQVQQGDTLRHAHNSRRYTLTVSQRHTNSPTHRHTSTHSQHTNSQSHRLTDANKSIHSHLHTHSHTHSQGHSHALTYTLTFTRILTPSPTQTFMLMCTLT